MSSVDFSTLRSRLWVRGDLVLDTALRIGAGRAISPTQPDLPILRDALGRPYIPGSSLKGALRSFLEAFLRGLQASGQVRDQNLACDPLRRERDEASFPVCLTPDEVRVIQQEEVAPRWAERLPHLAPRIRPFLEDQPPLPLPRLRDEILWHLSCRVCRLFGAPWLASRVLIRDLPLVTEPWPTPVRDGVAIDRDTGTVYGNQKYTFETLAPGARFALTIQVENPTPEDLGLLWIGLRALERGEILLGGARSRGLGHLHWEPEAQGVRLWDALEHGWEAWLAQEPLGRPVTDDDVAQWTAAFLDSIGWSAQKS